MRRAQRCAARDVHLEAVFGATMKLQRFSLALLATAGTLLATFAVFEATSLSEFFRFPVASTQSRPWLALLGVGLLVLDVLFPVPSSVIMIAHGAWFGIALGAALSTLGGTLATLAAYALGRSGSRAFERLVTAAELQRASALFERFGLIALVVTRPVPILAETMALAAGASRFSAVRTGIGGVLGCAPAATLYAWSGTRGLDTVNDGLLFTAVIGVSAATWWFGKRALTS